MGHIRHKSSDISTDLHTSPDEAIISHCTTININQPQSQGITINGSSVTINNKNSLPDASSQGSVQDDGVFSETRETASSNDNISIELDSSVEAYKKEITEIDNSMVNFNQNREQWQRRANSQSHIKVTHTVKLNRHSENWIQRQNHTPDLVMDLPLVSSSSPKETTKKSISVSANLSDTSSEEDACSVKSLESPTGPESPDMQTAAERFAKQNQCTLKKNTKIHIDASTNADKADIVPMTSPMPERRCVSVSSGSKPLVKAKPPVLKKPIFSVPLAVVSSEVIRKDQPDLPT